MDKSSAKSILISLIPAVMAVILSVGAGFIYGRELNDIIRNTIMSGAAFLPLIYGWHNMAAREEMPYDNPDHPGRFFIICIIGVVFSCILPLFPKTAWPLLPFFIALTIFGNSFLGLYTGAGLCMMGVLLSGNGADVFFMYFIPGTMSVLLFNGLTKDIKVGLPLFLSHLLLFLCECGCTIIYLNQRFYPQMLFIPALNAVICLFFSFLAVRVLSSRVLQKEIIEHVDLADPEHGLMIWQKEVSPEDYYHGVHTAYFAERIAYAAGADVILAKAGAYYQNIPKIYRDKLGDFDNPTEIVKKVCVQYSVPETIERVMCELTQKNYVSREATIVMFSDAVVTSVKYLMDKHPGQVIDYSKVVDMIMQRKRANGSLKNSLIALNDMDIMRDIFVKEDLYYDFLRSES